MNQQLTFHSKIKPCALDNSVQSILVRMVQLAQDHFDVKLEFKFWGDHDSKDEWIFAKLKTSRFLVFPTDSYFPICLENNIIGVAHIHGSLSGRQAQKMMEMIELIVDSTLKAAMDLSSLETLEEKMQLLDPEKNILRMDQFQQKPLSLLHARPTPEKRRPTQRFCRFIYEKDVHLRRKKAFDTHEPTGNYAFLNINDLSEKAFSSHSAFTEIGPITIYVSEVSDLDANMQKFLSDSFSQEGWEQGPSIAFGSRYPFFEPKVEFLVEPSLFQTLRSHLVDPLDSAPSH